LGVPDPTVLPLSVLCHNPFNPREQLTDLEETAESLRAKGQIQPVTVVRRAAFLAVHSGEEEHLGDADYVVIDGNRRLAAAHVAGLEKLRVDVNDDLAVSAADILESALIANVHRVDVPPLDQARAIQELVEVHGSQGKVAKRLGKTPAWVSQRLALLELTPELQGKVEAGALKVEAARRIGRLPKEEQAAEAEKTVGAVKAPRQRSRRAASDAAEPQTVNAVNTSEPTGSSPPASAETGRGVDRPADEAAARPPAPQTINGVNGGGSEDAEQHIVVRCASPQQVVDALVARLSRADLLSVANLLLNKMSTPSDTDESDT
jgi:ParB family chromosome partitioning protein